MPEPPVNPTLSDPFMTIFLERLGKLFEAMDRAYAETAAGFGFECRGCESNCCQSRFYHHTHLEYHYLNRGFMTLPVSEAGIIMRRAERACLQASADEGIHAKRRSWCPLSMHGRCLLYPYRPMICRLHGISHEVHLPGRGAVQGRGCDEFLRIARTGDCSPLDRTPYYRQLSELELEFRTAVPVTNKIKLTVAEMIVTFSSGDNSPIGGGDANFEI